MVDGDTPSTSQMPDQISDRHRRTDDIGQDNGGQDLQKENEYGGSAAERERRSAGRFLPPDYGPDKSGAAYAPEKHCAPLSHCYNHKRLPPRRAPLEPSNAPCLERRAPNAYPDRPGLGAPPYPAAYAYHGYQGYPASPTEIPKEAEETSQPSPAHRRLSNEGKGSEDGAYPGYGPFPHTPHAYYPPYCYKGPYGYPPSPGHGHGYGYPYPVPPHPQFLAHQQYLAGRYASGHAHPPGSAAPFPASAPHGSVLIASPTARGRVQRKNGRPRMCSNCKATTTPAWRRDHTGNDLLCNACGLYQKLHNKARPFSVTPEGKTKALKSGQYSLYERLGYERPAYAAPQTYGSPSPYAQSAPYSLSYTPGPPEGFETATCAACGHIFVPAEGTRSAPDSLCEACSAYYKPPTPAEHSAGAPPPSEKESP